MTDARLEVTDALGRRVVPIDRPLLVLGRRSENDVRLVGSDVSRDHAQIEADGDHFLIRDRGSRYGTYVNGEQVTERRLKHGDRIRLGRSGDPQILFLLQDATTHSGLTSSAVGDLHQVAVLLDGLRALGTGRVLDEVLALVIDSAIEVSGAERGFIMLADEQRKLEFKLGRARGRVTLPGRTFETSRKIPEEVFTTGEERVVADLLDGDLGAVHTGTVALGIRHVFCVPLSYVRYVDQGEAVEEGKRIGVLYLDSREKGSLLSAPARGALQTLATEAAVAIENARLYRESAEKARLEHELRIAGEIQQALLPPGDWNGGYFEAAGTTIPCRAIGGDFFDYLELPSGVCGFALADVSGKGPPAALLTAMLQGVLADEAQRGEPPAMTLARINRVLVRRSLQARFATMLYGVLARDGRLTYCNAGHNPPFLVSAGGVRRLDTGGLILGTFEQAQYAEETLQLRPGDLLVVFSDGMSEALSASGEEFGDSRILACIQENCQTAPAVLLNCLVTAVKRFCTGAAQSDDLTAVVVRYGG